MNKSGYVSFKESMAPVYSNFKAKDCKSRSQIYTTVALAPLCYLWVKLLTVRITWNRPFTTRDAKGLDPIKAESSRLGSIFVIRLGYGFQKATRPKQHMKKLESVPNFKF